MSSLKPHDLSPVFNDRTLHSEADAEEWYTSLSCKANGLNFSFNSPLAETAWYKYAVVSTKQTLGTLSFYVCALDSTNPYLGLVMHSGMVDCLVNGFVGIFVLCIFAYHGNRYFMPWIPQSVQQVSPWCDIQVLRGHQAKFFYD